MSDCYCACAAVVHDLFKLRSSHFFSKTAIMTNDTLLSSKRYVGAYLLRQYMLRQFDLRTKQAMSQIKTHHRIYVFNNV